MATVYIETTIPSYYHTARTSVQALAWREQTRVWWRDHRSSFDLVTSNAVIDELKGAPSERAMPRLALLAGVPLLNIDDRTREIAAYYLEHRLMPRSAEMDAIHVALASRHQVEFVLTWNCRHLANANKAAHLAVLNGRLRLPAPILTTPYNLVQ